MNESPSLQVLSFIDWYSPAYKGGGPIRSLLNLSALLRQNISFSIICSKYEIDGTLLNVAQDQWTHGPSDEKVFYCVKPKKKEIQKWLIAHPNGCFHINGMYSFSFSILPLLFHKLFFSSTKLVVSPRGMLNPGARAIKPLKKKAYLYCAKILGLYAKAEWHATSAEEAQWIQHFFGSQNPLHVLSNIPIPPLDKLPTLVKQKGSLKMYSSTRIVPIKQLEVILKALQQVNTSSAHITYHLYGPIEDQTYAASLEKMAKEIVGLDFALKGPLTPEELTKIRKQYHLFCLPSANENFGHAIYESFSNACPVIISDQTPWHALEKEHAGFDINCADLNAFASSLQKFCDMEQIEWQTWQEGALAFARKHFKREEWIKGYLALFANHADQSVH
jgi:glycosyltransferase involved in cell wall biosynthesis